VKIIQRIGIGLFILALVAFAIVPFLSNYKITHESLEKIAPHFQDAHRDALVAQFEKISGHVFTSRSGFIKKHDALVKKANRQIEESGNYPIKKGEYWDKEYKFWTLRYAVTGFFESKKTSFIILIFVVGIIGAFMHIIPLFWEGPPGIKHNNIYHNPATTRGWIGIVAGVYFIGFYIILYFYPSYQVQVTCPT